MTNEATATKTTKKPGRSLTAVDGGGSGAADKPKKERKPRAPRAPGGGGFLGELRATAAKHRSGTAKLRAAEAKLESKLATVRALREAAEGPLREVEEILARHPELPGVDADQAAPDAYVPAGQGDEVNQ